MHPEHVPLKRLSGFRNEPTEMATHTAKLNVLGLNVVGDVAAIDALVFARQATPHPNLRPLHLALDQVVKL